MRRGVYIAKAELLAATDPRQRHALDVAALLLVLRFDAVAGGSSAARIWGLDLLTPTRPELIVVTADPSATARRRADYTVRTATLPQRHRAVQWGVPVTTAARTTVDLARTSSFAEGVVVADSALRSGKASLSELHEVLRDCYCWQGIRRAQRVVAAADPKSESPLESLSRVAILSAKLPQPETQAIIEKARARVDFLWEEFGVVGEADGLTKYEPDGVRTTREIVQAEKRREERITDAGYEIVRWGWGDACDPRRLAQRLQAAFERGRHRRRGRLAA